MAFIHLPNTFKSVQDSPFTDKLDKNIQTWLLDRSSLTQRITEHCLSQNSQFKVRILKQKKEIPELQDSQILKISNKDVAYVREVLLHCGELPVVYAKTIIPLTTLTGKQKELLELGNKPLGEYLFSQPNLHRDPIEIARIEHDNKKLWGRRSTFYLEEKPLLVYEIFLADLITAIVDN